MREYKPQANKNCRLLRKIIEVCNQDTGVNYSKDMQRGTQLAKATRNKVVAGVEMFAVLQTPVVCEVLTTNKQASSKQASKQANNYTKLDTSTRQTDRQTDRQTAGQAGTQAVRQPDS